jgi:hypothetical protein
MDEIDGGIEHAAPIWAVFGDLMSGLLGAFVLILVGVLGVHLELASSLETEVQKRKVEEQRRVALEQALAGPWPRAGNPEQRAHRHQRQRAVCPQFGPAAAGRPGAPQDPGCATDGLPRHP